MGDVATGEFDYGALPEETQRFLSEKKAAIKKRMKSVELDLWHMKKIGAVPLDMTLEEYINYAMSEVLGYDR